MTGSWVQREGVMERGRSFGNGWGHDAEESGFSSMLMRDFEEEITQDFKKKSPMPGLGETRAHNSRMRKRP